MKELPERPQWETIPRGTTPATCRGETCGDEVYWIERKSRNKKTPDRTVRVPVDVDVPGAAAPDSLTDGRGVSHYQLCPDADSF
jgi:hypothetical protein